MRYFAVVLAIAASVGIYFSATPKPAQCESAYCTGNSCYGSAECGPSCNCLKSGTGFGKCVSLE